MTSIKTKILTPLICGALLLMTGCDLFSSPEESRQPENPGQGLLGQSGPLGKAADSVFSLNYSTEKTMNPLSSTSSLNLAIAPLVYEPLFEVDENMSFRNVLCREFEVTNGGLTYMIKVDTEAKFHDGSTFTASDAYGSILLAQQSSKYKNRLSIIEGVSPMGTDTLMVTLKKVNTQFPALLNVPMIKYGAGYEMYPAGSGPYRFSEDQSSLVIFDEHPDADELPIDIIYLKEYSGTEEMIEAFEVGYIDLVINDATGISNLGYGGATDVRYMPTTSMHYIGFNTASSYFKNSAARHSMTFIINRNRIVSDIMNGCASEAYLPMNPVSPLYPGSYAAGFSYSPERCLASLEGAGVISGKDNGNDDDGNDNDDGIEPPIDTPEAPQEQEDLIFIVNNESAVKVSAARDIARNMESIGIGVDLQEIAYDDFILALEAGNYDMYYGEVMLTPDFDLSPLLTAGGSVNYGRYHDENCELVISNYLSAPDDERKDAAQTMLTYINESAPILAIAFERQEVITHRGVVVGMSPTQYNVFNKITNWEIALG